MKACNRDLTQDDHKNITVDYNYLNLPTKVERANKGEILWRYDATGRKLSKEVLQDSLKIDDNPIPDKKYYANWISSMGEVVANSDVEFIARDSIVLLPDFSAKNNFTAKIGNNEGTIRHYVNGIEYFEGEMEAIYHEVGRVFFEENLRTYEFTIADHLGNTRTVFKGNNSVAEVVQVNDYYAFGLEFETQEKGYNYNYSGKEAIDDLDLSWSDFGSRLLMKDIGRWGQVDPSAEMYLDHSSYNYVLNNPIGAIDPNGENVVLIIDVEKESVTIEYNGVLIDKTGSLSSRKLNSYRKKITKQIGDSFTGSGGNMSWDINVNLRVGDEARGEGSSRESTINLVTSDYEPQGEQEQLLEGRLGGGSSTHLNGFDAYVNLDRLDQVDRRKSKRDIAVTAAHEVGHTMGLPHILDNLVKNRNEYTLREQMELGIPFLANFSNYPNSIKGNLMTAGPAKQYAGGDNVTRSQIIHIINDYRAGVLNNESHSSNTGWGAYSTDTPVYEYIYSRFAKTVILQKRQ